MDPNPADNITPSKSCLKRKTAPPPAFSQNDETVNDEIKFHFTDSSADDDSDGASDLPAQFIHFVDGSPCADYRRLFSMSKEQRAKLSHRKTELGQFFPPKYPKAEDARKRYEKGEAFLHEKAEEAWKNSASSVKMYKYDAMRKRINVDAVREKYNKKKTLPKKEKNTEASTSKQQRSRSVVNNHRKNTTPATAAADDDLSEHESDGDDLQDQYLTNLLSNSVPRTTPAHSKNNVHKPTTRRTRSSSQERIAKESSAKVERSYIDESGDRNATNQRRGSTRKL